MSTPVLGHMSVDDFLANYWQKKAVVIRQGFANFVSPISPDELAGLTTQEGVLSRLILEQGGDYPWQMKSGPLKDSDYEGLSDHHWTILVQEVDRHVPAVCDLFDRFNFLPSWRKDDVMVSFATRDSGVGAHIDSYDVFLLQGSGKRKWEIGEAIVGSAPADGGLRAAAKQTNQPGKSGPRYIEGLDVRILADFEATESFVLEPGDMLYLPPGVPHNGVALEPCLTFSFGFLAPSQADMLSDFADWRQQERGPVRYSDLGADKVLNSGLIDSADIERVRDLVQSQSETEEDLVKWFGCFITRPQRGPVDCEEFDGTLDEFLADFLDCQTWRRHEGLRIAGWTNGQALLFADGENIPHQLTSSQLEKLTGQRELTYDSLAGQDDFLELLFKFTCRGWGYFAGEETENE